MKVRLCAFLMLAAFAAGCSTQGAASTSGAGIQGATVRPASPVRPGRTCELPVYVLDDGSGTETLTIRAERLSPGRGRTVPPSWVTAAPVTLAAGHSATVTLRLAVPPGAKPGRYFSDVLVTGSAAGDPGSGGTASLGAGAATKLVFRVT